MFFSTLASMLFASANLSDSILMRGEHTGARLSPGAIIATSGIFNLLFAIFLGGWVLLTHRSIDIGTFLILVGNGLFYIVAIRIFLNVMNNESEPSRAIAWFQVIPVFGIIGAHLVLREVPGWIEALAIALLIGGGFVLSVKHGVARRKLMRNMIISAGLLAINDVIFAKFGRRLEHDIVSALFVNTAGIAFWGLQSLLIPQDRRDFVKTIKAKLGMKCISEVGFVGADVSMRIALLGTPVAIVQAIGCSQPLFVLIGETLLAKRYPDVFSTEGNAKQTRQKIIGIMLTVVGGIILALVSTK